MTSGIAAIGTQLQRNNSGVWLTIGDITNVGGPQLSADTAEVTSHSSLLPEIQNVVISGGTSGTFTLTVNGETTAAIAFDATASDIKTALEALSTVDKVLVDELATSDWAITFMGSLIGNDLDLMTIDDTSTDGTGTVTETQAGRGPWEEVTATVLRTGNVSLDLNFDPDGPYHQTILKDLRDKRSESWRLVFPDSTFWEFTALVTGYEPTSDHSDKLTGSISLKPTGQPTLDVSNATV